jgi:hypothetical protein
MSAKSFVFELVSGFAPIFDIARLYTNVVIIVSSQYRSGCETDALGRAADEGDGFVEDGHFLNIGCRV